MKEIITPELRELARKLYPIGTIFYCVHLKQNETVNTHKAAYDDLCIRVNGGGACVYDPNPKYGGWAKIISKPNSNKLYKIF